MCPGWIDTGLYERGLIGAKKAASNFAGMVQPDVVAARAMRDARRGKDISVYGAHVKGAHFASKLLPQKVMMKLWLKQQHLKLQRSNTGTDRWKAGDVAWQERLFI